MKLSSLVLVLTCVHATPAIIWQVWTNSFSPSWDASFSLISQLRKHTSHLSLSVFMIMSAALSAILLPSVDLMSACILVLMNAFFISSSAASFYPFNTRDTARCSHITLSCLALTVSSISLSHNASRLDRNKCRSDLSSCLPNQCMLCWAMTPRLKKAAYLWLDSYGSASRWWLW